MTFPHSRMPRLFTILAIFLLLAAVARAESAAADIPADAKIAVNALVMAMRGHTPNRAVLPALFAEGVRESVSDPRFRYQGFVLIKIGVSGLSNVKGVPGQRRLHGTLRFMDVAQRRISVDYLLNYRLQGNELLILGAAIRTVSPNRPQMRWYMVPEDDLAIDPAQPNLDHLQLMSRAMEGGIRKSDNLNWGRAGDYYMIGFVLDRLPAGANVEYAMRRGGNPAARGITRLNFDGWQVGVIRRSFKPIDFGKTFAPVGTLSIVDPSGEVRRTVISELKKIPYNPYHR